VRQEIMSATRRLADFPLSGRVVPEVGTEEYREIIVRDYRIIYRATVQQVRIVTVVHGRRDLSSLAPFDEV
jgi:plasmid stabilization system protein ParE